ncbi:hypothetical protein J6590_074914, partial [Homalodisca vitripennis]
MKNQNEMTEKNSSDTRRGLRHGSDEDKELIVDTIVTVAKMIERKLYPSTVHNYIESRDSATASERPPHISQEPNHSAVVVALYRLPLVQIVFPHAHPLRAFHR